MYIFVAVKLLKDNYLLSGCFQKSIKKVEFGAFYSHSFSSLNPDVTKNSSQVA